MGKRVGGTLVLHHIQRENLEDCGTCSFYYRSILNDVVMFFEQLV